MKKSITKIEKMTRLLSYIFKNDHQSDVYNLYGNIHGFRIDKKKLCKSKWVEHTMDFGGEYHFVPVTVESEICDETIAKAEEIYGKCRLEQERLEMVDSYVKELYGES